jgi:hypothetical protein
MAAIITASAAVLIVVVICLTILTYQRHDEKGP